MDLEKRKEVIEAVIKVLSTVDFITEEELFHIVDELGLEKQALKVCFKTNSCTDILEELKTAIYK